MTNQPPLRLGSLCTGYGGLDMAVQHVLGGHLTWVADNNPGAARILTHHHPHVPNLGDLTAIDWHQVRPVDVVLGGYPCQPFSSAGLGRGVVDERHIWPHIATALGVLRPRIAIFENVAGHLRRGFDTVLADLARLGFDVEWACVRASQVGAPHERKRLFIYAAAAHTPHLGHQRHRHTRDGRSGPAHRNLPAAHSDGDVPIDDRELPPGRDPVRQRLRDDPARCRPAAAADTDGSRRRATQLDLRQGQPDAHWGRFAPAIAHWEHILQRRAPRAVDDRHRLSPAFVEWMQGLPTGHVSQVPGLSRNAMLTALGNGVVPQQAAYALRLLSTTTGAHSVAA